MAIDDDGLNKALSEAFDKMEGAETPEAEIETPKQEAPAAPDVETEPTDTVEPSESEEKTEKTENKEPEKTEPVAATEDTTRPPSGWSPDAKAKFATLDESVRKEVLKREADFHKGIGEYKKGHEFARNFETQIAPYMPHIQAAGSDPITAFKNLMGTYLQLNSNPAATIAQLARQYGVALPTQEQYNEQQQVDPQFARLQAELNQVKGHLQQGIQAREQATQKQAVSEIDAFRADPKNIFFEDVRDDMALLLESGKASTVQDAYNKAIRMNDTVFQASQAQQQREAEQRRITEAKQKAANAKRAGFDVTGQGSVQAGKREMTLREMLEAQMP